MNKNDLKYWVGLSFVPGIGRIRVGQLQKHFGDMGSVWKASVAELRKAGLDTRTAATMAECCPRISLDEEIDKLEKYQVTAIPCDDLAYPARLKEIYDYPPVLFVRGQLLPEDECSVSIVGTRRATAYGRQITEEIVSDLSRSGVTIISGLARGVDSVAHRTALQTSGRTVAVFASGLDMCYPPENAALAREVMEHGALVSEHPLGTRPKAANFPLRNRIMSGLSLGVLVVEAGEGSGALITAHQANEQNREVFAVPGSILSPASLGTNRLIQAGEAKLVTCANDILVELNLDTAVARQMEMKEIGPQAVTGEELLLLNELTAEPSHVDDVCRKSGLPASTVSSLLTVLELKGMVKQIGRMNYVLARDVRARRN
jgi:DNA processing protein